MEPLGPNVEEDDDDRVLAGIMIVELSSYQMSFEQIPMSTIEHFLKG